MKSTIRLLLTLLITIGVASTSAFAQKPSSMSECNVERSHGLRNAVQLNIHSIPAKVLSPY